jgi:hypothetical protein
MMKGQQHCLRYSVEVEAVVAREPSQNNCKQLTDEGVGAMVL